MKHIGDKSTRGKEGGKQGQQEEEDRLEGVHKIKQRGYWKEGSAEEFFAQIDPSGNSSFLMGNSGLKSSSKTQTSQCVSLLNNTVKNMH